jgi:hypothetical protein
MGYFENGGGDTIWVTWVGKEIHTGVNGFYINICSNIRITILYDNIIDVVNMRITVFYIAELHELLMRKLLALNLSHYS